MPPMLAKKGKFFAWSEMRTSPPLIRPFSTFQHCGYGFTLGGRGEGLWKFSQQRMASASNLDWRNLPHLAQIK